MQRKHLKKITHKAINMKASYCLKLHADLRGYSVTFDSHQYCRYNDMMANKKKLEKSKKLIALAKGNIKNQQLISQKTCLYNYLQISSLIHRYKYDVNVLSSPIGKSM